MDRKNIKQIKTELRALGAKLGGNKLELQERLSRWKTKKLNKKIHLLNKYNFPNKENQQPCPEFISENLLPINTYNKENFRHLSLEVINDYFQYYNANSSKNKGRNLALNNFVEKILVNKSLSFLYVDAKCFAEKTKSKLYNVKLILNSTTADDLTRLAKCQCPAGVGPNAACKHISAVMHCIEHYFQTGKSLERISCTSQLQQWHKPTNKIQTKRLFKIEDFIREKDSHFLNDIYLPCGDQTDRLCNIFINRKIKQLLTSQRSVNSYSYFNDHDYIKSHKLTLLNKINFVDKKAIFFNEKKTRSQNSKLWFSLRRSRITASNAHAVIRTVASGKMSKTIAQRIINPADLSRIKAVRWGKKNEKVALSQYVLHTRTNTQKCGIFISEKYNFIAASPDAMSIDRQKIIEIKCPYKYRDECVTNVPYVLNGLNKNHPYYTQCQLQMMVTNMKTCDFVVWTRKGINIQQVKYSPRFIKYAVKNIKEYYKTIFAEEYFKQMW